MKKRISNIISVILTLIMLTGYIVPVHAVSTAPTLTIDSTQAVKGSNVSLRLSVSNNPGMAAATFKIIYDGSILKLNSVDFNTEFGGDFDELGSLGLPVGNSDTLKAVQISWSSMSNITTNGTFLTMAFTVAPNAKKDSIASVKVVYNSGDFCNIDEEDITFSTVNGGVTVVEGIPGDINGDKVVNSKDLIRLRKYFTGWDVEVDILACDCNGDGNVNSKDLIRLRKYFSGWAVELMYGSSSTSICKHTLTKVVATEATCTEPGNIEYWLCNKCNKCYADENALSEITAESTVIEAKGHTTVVDPAVEPTYESEGLTEGSHCSACGTVFKKQEPISKLQKTEYSITYHISNGDEYLAQQTVQNANPTTYSSEQGVSKFANPYVPGYQFLGWYDLPSGSAAENVKSIPVGTTGNIDLYARWEKISYKINFSSDLIPVASETYTVDEEHVLPAPKLDGYIFAGWSNAEGEVIKNIPSGTVGVKTYTANWLSERNQAWSKKKIDPPIIYEDSDTGTILFAYNIGEIRNVPLQVIHDFGKINSDGISRTVTKTFSSSINTEEMQKYTNTIQKATTDSYSWTLSKDWSDSTTVSESWCKEQGITTEEANTICKTDSSNWYISRGDSGSKTTEELGSADEYDLTTTTKNSKNSTSQGTTKSKEIDAKLEVEVPIKVVDVKGSVEYTQGKETTTGSSHEDASGESGQKGSIKHTGKDITTVGGWNNEHGRGGSSSVSNSTTVSKALSEKISKEYGYGKSYIQSESQSTQQGLTSAESNLDEYSSAVTYSKATKEEESTTYSTSNTKSGYHRWILAGTAHVFGVIGYDIKTGSYFTYTYSVMDDEIHEFEDYSYSYASYDDNENSVLPFEAPYDIADYVANRVCSSEGFEISKDGTITNYTGTDSFVLMPEYKVIDNQDGTKTIILVKAIAENVFKDNTNISTVILSDFITNIPKNAFFGCSSLEQLNGASITSIGDNALSGCTKLVTGRISDTVTELGENVIKGLDKLSISAANANVVKAAVQSGAKEISISVSNKCIDLNDVVLTVPSMVDTFTINGFGKTYKNLRIVSNAKETIINRINFVCNGQTPLLISSSNVELHETAIKSPGICLALTADNTNLSLRGECELTASTGNSMLCKHISLSQIDPALATSLTVKGNLLIATSKNDIFSGNSLLNVTGKIIDITTEDEFNNYLKGVFTVSFNANEGIVSESSKTVVYGSTYGSLPTPTRDYYTFDGWYTAKEGGNVVKPDTKFDSAQDITLYAHWIKNPTSDWVLASAIPAGASVVDQKWTYDLTSKTSSSSSSMSGWTKYDTKRTGWGGTQGPVYSNPSNGSRNVWSEQYVTSTTTHYVYYHRYKSNQWSDDAHASSWARHSGPDVTSPLPNGYYSPTTGQRYSGAACSVCGATNQWHLDRTYTTDNYGTRWYYQEPVYTYYYKKTEAKESTTEVTASDSISNVQKYVKYILK